ncbi:MAG: hypothetical protein PHX05_02395 [Acidobacteriota bacterium]|nr:hypothetical protein [Acidobacteriota bacterium]
MICTIWVTEGSLPDFQTKSPSAINETLGALKVLCSSVLSASVENATCRLRCTIDLK